jgi:predicted AlkP superfamily phosphohydrolase/phosphomutase
MVIGLDAATFRLLRPWAEEGRLPNLKRFLDEGAFGVLRSTVPPNSPAAWSTFATGVNPGAHGILTFHQFFPHDYNPHLMNAARRSGETFWEIAGRHGRKGGIINLPYTYPAKPYNGFMITGMLTPGMSRAMASPPELYDDLMNVEPGYAIDVDLIGAVTRDPIAVLDKILANLRARLNASLGLYRKHRPDLFCVVFVAADRICHHFWPYLESKELGAPQTAVQRRLSEAIRTVYEELDRAVGALVAEAGPETDVIIMSDHGTCGFRRGISLRNALAKEGLLTRQRNAPLRRLAKWAVLTFARRAPRFLKMGMERLFPAMSRRAVGTVAHADVDFSRSLAYPTGLSRGVFVNLKGRQPNGIVEPADYEAVRDRIIDSLSRIQDPETGRPALQRVCRREEIWSGARLDEMPDIVVEPAGSAYSIQTFSGLEKEDALYDLPKPSWTRLQLFGGHDPEGVLMAKGPHIRGGEITGAGIIDLPATILALLGCPVPAHFEGRVLADMLTDDVKYAKDDTSSDATEGGKADLSDEERMALEKRLKQLGYM